MDKCFPIFSTLTSDRRHSVWELIAMRIPPRAMHEMSNGWLAIFMHHGEFLFTLSSFRGLCCFSVQWQKHFFWVAQHGNWVLDPTNPAWQRNSRPVAWQRNSRPVAPRLWQRNSRPVAFSLFVCRNVDLNYWLRSIIQYLCMSPNSVLATAFYLLSLDEDL